MESPKRTLNPIITQLDHFFPILFPVGLVLFLVAVFALVSFYFAETPTEVIELGQKPMPLHWEAGVYGHGSYYRWLIAANHPFLFGFSVVLFFGSWFLMIATTLSKRFLKSEKVP